MITKELILKQAKKKDMRLVYELRLSDMKIEKLENLEDLVKLREIDLSGNMLKEVEQLNCLKELRSLNLSSNAIVLLPPLKFPYLQKLDLSYNALGSMKNLSLFKVPAENVLSATRE
ncbi:MAG: leucine-rich repeat domain-containing protein [Candidatus Pacebacteria bacterium]|nr:leucine-rich repeat domain-containing protein [Candidatus Paceibacterota bacterium]